MMFARVVLLALLLQGSLWLYPGLANDVRAAERPRIGLALSGGGARGAAHVGVLEVLEELGVPIDYIAGTSMGSVIGGLYALGMSPKQIQHELITIDWEGVFDDKPERPDRSFRRKQDDRSYLANAKPGVKDGRVNLPTALVQGQRFDLELRRLTLSAAEVNDFDDLRIPFRAVATDISTGEEVVLGAGDLALAMRASMAVPAAFAGVEWDGRPLVDGGIVNNLPVSVVRDMGADIVIAVDISTPLAGAEELKSALAVLGQLSSILTRRNTEKQIKSLTARDVLIVPALGDISSADFDRASEAVPIGREAAESSRSRLQQLALSESDYAQYRTRQAASARGTPIVAFVRFENESDLADEVLAGRLLVEPGDPLDLDQIENGIDRIYGLDVFESVRYQVVREDGEQGLVITAKEKSWGTSFLQLGLDLSATLSDDGDSRFNIGALYTHMPLNRLNGEWRTGVQIGEEPSVVTELYQPLDPLSRNFLQGALYHRTDRARGFAGGKALAEYAITRTGIDLGIGREFATWGAFKLGYRRYSGDLDVTTGEPVFGEGDFDGGEVYARLDLDDLDDVNFPRFGQHGNLIYTASRESLGADVDYDQVSFKIGGARSRGDDTLLGTFWFGTTLDDDAPIQNQFALGGFLNLSGLQKNELMGQHGASAILGYMRRLYRDRIFPVYAGVSVETGNVWQASGDIGFDDLIFAGSAYLGADTPMGPLYLGYGHAEGGRDTVYLFLGQPWF